MNNAPSSSPRRPDVPRKLKIFVVVNTVLLVAVLGGVLWVVTRPLGPAATEYGLTMDGEALLKDEAARRGRAEGQLAPGFTHGGDSLGLTSLDGDPVELSSFHGRPVWIVFWATYCHACQKEEPDLRRAFEAHRADGLVLLAIDVGEDAADVRRYTEARNPPWTVLLDSGTAVDAFGAIGTPIHYFIGADGTIVSRAFGRLSYAEMDDHLATLIGLGGAQPTPPEDGCGAATGAHRTSQPNHRLKASARDRGAAASCLIPDSGHERSILHRRA